VLIGNHRSDDGWMRYKQVEIW